MKWDKLGCIISIDHNYDWMKSHAALPTVEQLSRDIYRVYFSPRDKNSRSHIASFDINMNEPFEIMNLSTESLLAPSENGLFDDAGVLANCVVDVKGKKHMYYTGWSLGVTTPFYTYCGLAIWDEKSKKYKKIGKVPILDRTNDDPYSIGTCYVLDHDGKYKMWYESRESYCQETGKDLFVIKYAESKDGLLWERPNIKCIVPSNSEESMIARPSVIIENGIYKMWYSFKVNNKYRMGYAESRDGINWIRKDKEVGIRRSGSGWDSEEIEYPCVFDHKGNRYMLYNGNGYGKTGIGLARLMK